ncbi:E3 ubiquitin-protein ligase PUB24 [Linum perenne]
MHRAGIAVVGRGILKVSPTVDERAVLILSSLCKFSGTNVVLQEMLSVKAVSKLCLLMQADAATYLKEKAAEMLRMYSGEEWKSNPCVDACLLSRYHNQSYN